MLFIARRIRWLWEFFSFAAPSENLISEKKAKEIALKHAGYEESEVRFVKAKLDRDDGRYEYEIEFRADGNLEYDYSINAVNGKIVEFDRDYDAPDRFEAFNFFKFFNTKLIK